MTFSKLKIAGVCLFISFCITSCSKYQVVLNENVLYSPTGAPPKPGILSDANFQGCLNQYLLTSENKEPEDVTLLACPASGIQSLVGINALVNLEQLELSDNNIGDLSPLLSLKKLRVLSIRNNRVDNINSLMSLPLLRFVALQGNNSISCRQLNSLEEKIGNTLNRPVNCDN